MIVDVEVHPSASKSSKHTQPFLVVQNDVGNSHSSVTIVAAIVPRDGVEISEVHVEIPPTQSGLAADSVILCDQLWSMNQEKIVRMIQAVDSEVMASVNAALKISLGLDVDEDQ